jgi:hypothetical protein
LTGRTGTRASSRQAPDAGDAHAGGEHHRTGGEVRAVLELDAADHPIVDGDGGDAGARAQLAAGPLDGLGEGGDQAPGVDRVVVAHGERQPDRGREPRLESPRLARAQALDSQAERAAKGEQPLERRGLVAVARDQHGARAAVPGIATGDVGQLDAERLEGPGAAQPEVEQRALSELRLGHGGEHAGGDVPRAGITRIEHHRAQTASGRAPGAREPDRPAADDGDVPRLRCCHCGIPSLRRHYPDQVRRSAARCRPLSPIAGSRCGHCILAGRCQTGRP